MKQEDSALPPSKLNTEMEEVSNSIEDIDRNQRKLLPITYYLSQPKNFVSKP